MGRRTVANPEREGSAGTALPAPETVTVPRLENTDRLVEKGLRLHLVDAVDGGPPGRPTVLRLGHRAGRLLVRFDGRDPSVVATILARDGDLFAEDVCEVFLGPESTPAVYYEFEINPLGTVFDARIASPDLDRRTMRVDRAWRCPGLRTRSLRRPGRWSAVFSIPLRELYEESDSSGGIWRANFFRIDRDISGDEYTAWRPTGQTPPNFHVPERFGTLALR
jgi:Carbohydrate-binding family 9